MMLDVVIMIPSPGAVRWLLARIASHITTRWLVALLVRLRTQVSVESLVATSSTQSVTAARAVLRLA